MNESHHKSDALETKISEAIKTGKLSMRPRWHFVLKAALGALGILLALSLLLFFASLLVFNLHAAPPPVPGPRPLELLFFFRALPWTLILGSLLLVALVEYLLRKHQFGYRKPVLYTLIALLALTCLSVAALNRVRAHERFYRFFDERETPVMGTFYRHFGPPSGSGRGARNVYFEVRRP